MWLSTGVVSVNILSAASAWYSAEVAIDLLPRASYPALFTQPRNVFPVAVGAVGKVSPVPVFTPSPVKPLAAYPSSW